MNKTGYQILETGELLWIKDFMYGIIYWIFYSGVFYQ